MREQWDGKFAIKGVASPNDAQKCLDIGADAIWISNHGGRQLDTGCATIDLLPKIAQTVDKRAEIITVSYTHLDVYKRQHQLHSCRVVIILKLPRLNPHIWLQLVCNWNPYLFQLKLHPFQLFVKVQIYGQQIHQ